MLRFAWLILLAVAHSCAAQTSFADPPTTGPEQLFRRPSRPTAQFPVAPAKPEEKPQEKPRDTSGAPAPQTPDDAVAVEQSAGREVDSAEVLRRGDRVTRGGVGPESRSEQLLGDATAPPPDDSHKWFVTIIEDGGQASQALLYDLKHSPHLRAWANVDEPKESWAHVSVYGKDDATQHWRWSSLRITQFPVMLIQPPAKLRDESQPESWIWGNPKIVVWQWDGYDSTNPNRAQLRSDAIRKALGAYVSREAARQQRQGVPRMMRESPPATPGSRQGGVVGGPEQRDDYGIAPPFSVPTVPTVPNLPVFPPDPSQAFPGPNQAPQTPSALSLLLSLFGGAMGSSGLTNILMLSLIGVQMWRGLRKATGQPTLLDDATFARLEEMLRALSGQQKA